MNKLLAVCLMVIGLGVLGMMDYTDEQTEHNQYKADVCEGIYPDYKKIGVECE